MAPTPLFLLVLVATAAWPAHPARAQTESAPNAVITVLDTAGMAPFTVHVNALNSSLGGGTPLNVWHRWDFDDPSGAYNRVDGFNAAHVYDEPGTYQVKLTLINSAGEMDEATASIVVSADTRQRIYVSAAGNDANNGSSTSSPVRTPSRAFQLQQDNCKILFRRGDTFNSGTNSINSKNVVVGAYGSGSRPVLRWNGPMGFFGMLSVVPGGADDVTIQDLAFDSIYDADDDRDIVDAIYPANQNCTIRNCDFLEVTNALNNNRAPTHLLAMDNDAGVLGAYFAWVQGSDHTYLGNDVDGSHYEHNIRLSGPDRILIAHNDLKNSPKRTVWAVQGDYHYISANRLRDGRLTIAPNVEVSDPNAECRWVVIERNITNKNDGGNSSIELLGGSRDVMVRNNAIESNSRCITVSGYDSATGRIARDVHVLNNTGINPGSIGGFAAVGDGAEDIAFANNLYSAPSLVTGTFSTANLYVTSNNLASFDAIHNNVWAEPDEFVWVPDGYHYVWPYWSNAAGYRNPAEWEAFAVVSNEGYDITQLDVEFTPALGSVATSFGTPVPGVFNDLDGATRPCDSSTWTAGAVEWFPANPGDCGGDDGGDGGDDDDPPSTFPFIDDFEGDLGWQVQNSSVISGAWARGVPSGGGVTGDPTEDYDGSGKCYLTGISNNVDLDGGPTRLLSPVLNLDGANDPHIGYALWFSYLEGSVPDDTDPDVLVVEISSNAGSSWTTVQTVTATSGWEPFSIRVADYVTPTAQVRLRFSVADSPNDSVTEAAVDDVRLWFGDDDDPPGAVVFADDFDDDLGWNVTNIELEAGAWELGAPAGDGTRGDPTEDADGSGSCYLTGNGAGDTDVDGGPTSLISPSIDMTGGSNPVVHFAAWFTNNDDDLDRLRVDVSPDGIAWIPVMSIAHADDWRQFSFAVNDYISPSGAVRVRFAVADNPNDSITEAAIDDVVVCFNCAAGGPGDANGDGSVDVDDIVAVVTDWGACSGPCPADLNGDGVVDADDLVAVIINWS